MRRLLFLHGKVLKLYNGEFINGYSVQFHDSNEFWEIFPKTYLGNNQVLKPGGKSS